MTPRPRSSAPRTPVLEAQIRHRPPTTTPRPHPGSAGDPASDCRRSPTPRFGTHAFPSAERMTIDVSPAVADALAAGRPVVALETTILCHGIPRPRNRELAAAIEDAVRAAGAIPATTAVIDGRIRIGLATAELEQLLAAAEVAKCSTPRPARHSDERRARRDDGGGDHVRGRAHRHPDHGDRRHRRRAPGRRTHSRPLGRSRMSQIIDATT